MASSHPQDEGHSQQAEDCELERIINMLAYCRRNALTHLNNLTKNLDALSSTASVTLGRYVSLRGVSLSSVEVKHILDCLTHASVLIGYARTEIDRPLRDAEHNAERALDIFTHEELQQMIDEGMQNSLWRRVACRRGNATLHGYLPFLFDHASTAEFFLEKSRDDWELARSRLKARMEKAILSLQKVLQALAMVIHRTMGNVSDHKVQVVHPILSAVQDIVVLINDTILLSFEQAITTIEALRKSAADEIGPM